MSLSKAFASSVCILLMVSARAPSRAVREANHTLHLDPPKHGVREAIGTLRRSGIQVVMVTGDHPLTAEAIARRINLISGDTKESLSKKTGRFVRRLLQIFAVSQRY